jgi:hypothetical protein
MRQRLGSRTWRANLTNYCYPQRGVHIGNDRRPWQLSASCQGGSIDAWCAPDRRDKLSERLSRASCFAGASTQALRRHCLSAGFYYGGSRMLRQVLRSDPGRNRNTTVRHRTTHTNRSTGSSHVKTATSMRNRPKMRKRNACSVSTGNI